MTSTSIVCGTIVASTGLTGLALADSLDSGPWGLGITVGLGTLVTVLLRWMMARQDKMHEENRAAQVLRDDRQERREEARTKINEQNVAALQSVVTELRDLNRAIGTMPALVVDEIEKRTP